MSISMGRIWIWTAVAISMVIAFAVSKLLGVPAEPGFGGSILQQPSPIVAVIVVTVTAFACVGVSSLLTKRVHPTAPLACGLSGLAVFSWRGGGVFYSIAGHEPSAYLTLAFESILLLAIVAGAWLAFGGIKAERNNADPPETIGQSLLAVGCHMAVMLVLMVLLSRDTDKRQAMGAVFISSTLGAMAAYRFVPTRPSIFYWIAPTVLAVVGYINGYFTPMGQAIGDPMHYFGFLARPLPLDYIAAGIPGAIWGLAISQRHKFVPEDEPAVESAAS